MKNDKLPFRVIADESIPEDTILLFSSPPIDERARSATDWEKYIKENPDRCGKIMGLKVTKDEQCSG